MLKELEYTCMCAVKIQKVELIELLKDNGTNPNPKP